MQLFRCRRHDASRQHLGKTQLNDRRQNFAVQPLQHRPQHEQLFLVPLGHFGGRHARVFLPTGQHQEQIGVEGTVNPAAHVLHVSQQVVQVEPHLKQRPHRLMRARRVHVGQTARQHVCPLVLQRIRRLQRRQRHVIDGLRLALLLQLQLLGVAQRIHRRAGAINVAAVHAPARAQRREVVEPALAQHLARFAARLQVHAAPCHVLAVALAGVTLVARLNGVHHRHPGVIAPVVVQPPHRQRALIAPKLAHQLFGRHGELTVQRVHRPAVAACQRVLTHRHGVIGHHGIEVVHHHAGASAEGAQFLVARVQRQVGVGAGKHHAQQLLHVMQPLLDRRRLVQLRVTCGQPEPRSRRAGHARHQAGTERAQRAYRRIVQNVLIAPLALVRLRNLVQQPAGARVHQLGDLAPVRHPGGALRF